MNIYDLSVKTRKVDMVKLSDYKGKVLLIVNSATGCGFTPQYESLERLYKTYNKKGFEILDFPCNQFGHQAPGDDNEIHEFCTSKYQTTFDQFAKIDVNGENEDKLFTLLKSEIQDDEINGMKNKMVMKGITKISNTCKNKGDIVWNFTKFLVNKDGKVVKRLSPIENPDLLENDIKELLS